MSALNRLGTAFAAIALAFCLSACGEQVQVYEPGKYKGAPLAAPWDTPEYGGKQAAWERSIEMRTNNQNEYWLMHQAAR
jgi:hypothetical protein